MQNNNGWYVKLLELFKLETTTKHGRVNLVGVGIVAGFCLLYSASDVFRHAISAVESITKSIALNQNIHYEYESAGLKEAVVPVLIAFVLCLIFLAWHESRKNNKE